MSSGSGNSNGVASMSLLEAADTSTPSPSQKRKRESSEPEEGQGQGQSQSQEPLSCSSYSQVTAKRGRIENYESDSEIAVAMTIDHKLDTLDLETVNSNESTALKVMLNPVVLEKVAKLLPAGRLLTLRQTCTAWNLDFIPQLKEKHSRIKVKNSETGGRGSGPSPDNFAELLQSKSNAEIPFTNFSFFYRLNFDRHDPFQKLLPAIGNNIRSLEISWDQHSDFSVENDLKKILYELTPQLEELIVLPSVSVEDAEEEDEEEDEEDVEPKPKAVENLGVLPKLKRITLTTDINYDDNIWSLTDDPYKATIPLLCSVILSAEELNYLDLQEFTHTEHFDVPRTAFSTLRLLEAATPHLHKLKTLKTNVLKDFDLQALVNLATQHQQQNGNTLLRLDSFTTRVQNSMSKEDFQLLRTFLVSHTALKELVICFLPDEYYNPYPDDFTFELPLMEHLQKLSLVDFGLWPHKSNEIKFDGKFEDALPELKQLMCHQSEHEPQSDSESSDYDSDSDHGWSAFLRDIRYRRNRRYRRKPNPFAPLEKFKHSGVTEFNLTTEARDYTGFLKFSLFLPSLSKLVVSFKAETNKIDVEELAGIWTRWSALTVLHLTWENADDLNLDMDSFLSGVPRKKLERLRHEYKIDLAGASTSTEAELAPEMLRGAGSKYWSIADLKHLQDLSLTFQGSDKPQLTDMGGYFGVALASPSLQRVVIWGNGENLVSDQCRAFIRATLGPWAEISL